MKSFVTLVVCLLICFSAAATGAQFQPGAFYENLNKPPLNPPKWVFPVAWTLLYFMMGLSLWRIWESKKWPENRLPLFLFFGQLLLNALWSYLFFGLQKPLWGLVDILFLEGFLIAIVTIYPKYDKIAAALMVPYLLWVSFATYLNLMLVYLN